MARDGFEGVDPPPPEFGSMAEELGWDERRRRYAWRRKNGQTNPQIANAEGYSKWNAQRLAKLVYEDLGVRSLAGLINEIERRLRLFQRGPSQDTGDRLGASPRDHGSMHDPR